jgi:replicative DNA helicase
VAETKEDIPHTGTAARGQNDGPGAGNPDVAQAVSLQDCVTKTLEDLDVRYSCDRNLDAALPGLHPRELILLAARPAMGKTALAMQVAFNNALATEKTVLHFTLELNAVH